MWYVDNASIVTLFKIGLVWESLIYENTSDQKERNKENINVN